MKSKLLEKILNDPKIRKSVRLKTLAVQSASEPYVVWEP
jgi:hypothetical protein